MRLLKLGASLAAAKLADDSVDGAIGAGKARYVGAVVALALIAFQKGGEVRLQRGDTFEVEPDREALRHRQSASQPASTMVQKSP